MTSNELLKLVEKQYAANLPFVIYKNPNANKIGVFLQNDDTLHTITSFEEQGFVFAPFDSENHNILIPGEPIYADDINHSSVSLNASNKKEASVLEKEQHIALVTTAINYIKQTELQKVVVSRSQKVPAKNLNPVTIFKNLGAKYKNAFVYLWHHPKVGTWLGATPETLVSVNGRSFETMALAGTQPYLSDEEVNWGFKEQEEQQLVTDEIVSKLKPFNLVKFKVHQRENYRAGNLLHLRTRITGSFSSINTSIKDIIVALHPTPAVCGFPRDLAKRFIKEQESYDREFYTGFLGELNILKDQSKRRNPRNVENLVYKTLTKSTQLFVNLRCMQFKDNAAEIYIGGGITKDSDAVDEWEETVNKAQTIASIL
ncbi:chorismate-binding protein [Leeuwenhoekiella sp. NPDC079379]|uniref:chorismate-binding protein n=1 Tax=Leeuwenhoekiella sp. NPDC079379 TaxID=3364122 RepID=UPI0037CBA82D